MTLFYRPLRRGWSAVALWLGGSLALVSVLLSGAGAEGPVATSGAAPAAGAGGAPFTVPAVPSFTPSNTAAFSSVFSQCSGQALGTMISACGTSAEFDGEMDLACESLSAQAVASASLKISAAIGAQSCKKTQLSMARGKLDCVSKGASLLQAMIGQQRQQFESEIQYAQSALRQLTQVKKGFEEQDEFIGKRLNGDRGESGSGAIGLIEAQVKMEQALDDMNGGGEKGTGTIAIFKKANRDIDDRKKALLEQVQARTVELTGDCITRGGNDGKRYQCVPNGPDVSYLEFLACQYERSFSIGEGGRIERDAVNKKRGEAGSASLLGALREIGASIPKSIKTPGSEQIDSYYKNVNSLWFRFDDFKQGIRSKLVGFDNSKFQVSDRFLKKAQSCFGQARQQVAKERLGASSVGQGNGGGGKFLVDLQNEIKTSEEAQQSFARKFFLNANKTYADSVKALLGRNVTLALDSCSASKPAVQASCMDQINTSFEDVLLGKSDLSKVNMVVPGNGAVRDLVVQCLGLKGCTADLQAQHDYLKSTVKQVVQAKQKYAAEANQKIDAMRTSLARAVSFPNQLLIQQQDELNRFLAGLGVGASVELEDIEGKAFEKDEDEDLKPLYKNPVGDEFIQAISAGATPPLKKVGKDSFKEAYQGIAEAVKEADKQIGKLSSLQERMQGALAKCTAKEAEKLLSLQQEKDEKSQQVSEERNERAIESMDRAASDIESCGYVAGWCDDSRKGRLSELLSSLQGLTGEGLYPIEQQLESGLSACLRSGSGKAGDDAVAQCQAKFDSSYARIRSGIRQIGRSSGPASSSSAY